jgi:hypothetical protein
MPAAASATVKRISFLQCKARDESRGLFFIAYPAQNGSAQAVL